MGKRGRKEIEEEGGEEIDAGLSEIDEMKARIHELDIICHEAMRSMYRVEHENNLLKTKIEQLEIEKNNDKHSIDVLWSKQDMITSLNKEQYGLRSDLDKLRRCLKDLANI